MRVKTNTRDILHLAHFPVIWLMLSLGLIGVNVFALLRELALGHQIETGMWVSVGLTLLFGGIVARAMTRRSDIRFDAKQGELVYRIDGFWSTKNATLPLNAVQEAWVQSVGAAPETTYRLMLSTDDGVIPLSLTRDNISDCDALAGTVNEWLQASRNDP